ncbi:hypothetical protein UFOVP787_30 [uncultured Caudovirales phage]|uniref:Uncharacterized protein n=1 Tax=uncultured Caudovirales phage TaxID=2100421 RepID=A0A6J5NRB6_9CAUD|nr:hypothetical protein UFOVP787_30 [uncultured Caudovirales phage]
MAQFRKDTHQYLADGKTIFEVVMLSDQYGNLVGPANPSGMAVDAFGRARISIPLTLFDSSHRYKDNGLWSTSNTANTTYSFNSNAGLIELNLGTTANQEIIRETTKVFSYQPGKSLQSLNTVVMSAPKENLRQRVGYFGQNNGIYLEANGTSIAWVERSSSSGSLVETRVEQSNWNIDTLLGDVSSSPSQKTLDMSKAQIIFNDVEWLGLGTVRCGFVINGQLIHCHSFHHANYIDSTYMTTASLPLRYEIKNTGTTASNSTMKQVCSTVISEGGYELRGDQRSIGTPVQTPKNLTTAGTYYPIVSIRLKSDRLDAIAILTALSILGINSNPCSVSWRVYRGATLTSPSWSPGEADSSVEYDTAATDLSGGQVLAQGYIGITNQASQTIDILKEALFKFQLQRNGLTGTAEPLTIAISASVNTVSCLASMDWEEISR